MTGSPAITTDTFIVLTSNVFAILGLRAMYFLLAGMHERFHLLTYGLAIVLVLTMVLSLLIPPKAHAPRGAYPFKARQDSEGDRA